MTGMSKHLQVGQNVRLEDRAGLYQLVLLTADQAGSQIVELALDYVVLEDMTAGVRLRVPLHLITAVQMSPAPELQAA